MIARLLVLLLTGYRTVISPLRPPACRYTPTCSDYALEAIRAHGAGRGSWLAVRRLLRCHPFHAGGHDPVPPRVEPVRRETPPEPVSVASCGADRRRPSGTRFVGHRATVPAEECPSA